VLALRGLRCISIQTLAGRLALLLMLPEKIFAAVVLLLCVLALVHGALGARQRQQWDQATRRAADAIRRAGLGLAQGWRRLRARRGAAREAQDAIERARRAGPKPKGGDNVIRPPEFDRRRGRGDKLH
jgi:hypothetical protein